MNAYNALNAYDTLYHLGETVGSAASVAQLATIIDEALAVPAPDGIPSVISEVGNAYNQACFTLNGVTDGLNEVQNQLPAAWTGDAAETANQQVSWLAEVSNSIAVVIGNAGGALMDWASVLQQAQRSDTSGRDNLKQAYQMLQNMDPYHNPQWNTAVGLVRDGINSMTNGADTAVWGGGVASQQLMGEVNLHTIKPSAIDPSGSSPSAAVTPRQPIGSQLTSG